MEVPGIAFGSAATVSGTVAFSFVIPERTRISYLTALTGNYLCGSP